MSFSSYVLAFIVSILILEYCQGIINKMKGRKIQ